MAVASWSTAAKNRTLDCEIKGTTPTPPAGCYVAFFTLAGGQPTADGSDGVEESAGWYSRANLRAAIAAASGGQDTNSSALSYGTPTGVYGPYRWAVLFTAATGGARIAVGQLQFDVTTVNGVPLTMAIGSVVAKEQ